MKSQSLLACMAIAQNGRLPTALDDPYTAAHKATARCNLPCDPKDDNLFHSVCPGLGSCKYCTQAVDSDTKMVCSECRRGNNADCPSGQECVSRGTLPYKCNQDSDCPSDTASGKQYCVRPGMYNAYCTGCRDNNDCPTGQMCIYTLKECRKQSSSLLDGLPLLGRPLFRLKDGPEESENGYSSPIDVDTNL
ncbi:hypothetical protein B0H19DRAFT_1065452 [Mycena capillaripes]|nr:hypothetical protein B0H19DRAFT_1065452 [Mycena capillaripes]